MQILFISLTRKRLLCHEAVLLVSVSSASIHVQPEQHWHHRIAVNQCMLQETGQLDLCRGYM